MSGPPHDVTTRSHPNPPQWNLSYETLTIGFCGRYYPVMKLTRMVGQSRWPITEYVTEWGYAYSEQGVTNFVRDTVDEETYRLDYDPDEYQLNYRGGWISPHRPGKQLQGGFNRRMMEQQFNVREDITLFAEKYCPIFAVYRKQEETKDKWGVHQHWNQKITYNCKLQDYEFYRVFDPYTAFQELSMFMGNLVAPNKPIPEISDEIMAEIKGFNKFSFRKDKKKK